MYQYIHYFLNIYFIYLAALGLSCTIFIVACAVFYCRVQAVPCGTQAPLVVVHGLCSCGSWGSLVVVWAH